MLNRKQKLKQIINDAKAEIEEIEAQVIEDQNRWRVGKYFRCIDGLQEWVIFVTKVQGAEIYYEMAIDNGKSYHVGRGVIGNCLEEISKEEYERLAK